MWGILAIWHFIVLTPFLLNSANSSVAVWGFCLIWFSIHVSRLSSWGTFWVPPWVPPWIRDNPSNQKANLMILHGLSMILALYLINFGFKRWKNINSATKRVCCRTYTKGRRVTTCLCDDRLVAQLVPMPVSCPQWSCDQSGWWLSWFCRSSWCG